MHQISIGAIPESALGTSRSSKAGAHRQKKALRSSASASLTRKTPSAPLRASALRRGIWGTSDSLSKRSNLAGARFGFYAGDAELVHFLSEVRKHAGNMVPGPVQHAAVAALGDDEHVDEQRSRYWDRLATLAELLRQHGLSAETPEGDRHKC